MAKGKPSKGTPADKRMKANKDKKTGSKKGGFVPFSKGGKKTKGK
jgi:hypothetical protein